MKPRYLYLIMICILFSSVALAAYDSADSANETPLEISRITPDGMDVPTGRQIVIQFNRPVVPLGRMERTADEIPVDIHPELKGQWRWLNTSALAFQLDHDAGFSNATRYTVTVNPGITTMEGNTLSGPYIHSFITTRPAVRYKNFKTWKSPGTPVIRLTFNQPVTRDSVAEHLYMDVSEKPGKRVDLSVSPDPDDYGKPVMIQVPGEPYGLHFGVDDPVKSDDTLKMVKKVEARRVWLLKPISELPLDTSMELKIEPGLVSASGPEKGVTNRVIVGFDTFPEFRFLGVRCYINKNNDMQMIRAGHSGDMNKIRANPLEYTALAFSSPVIFEEVRDNVLISPDLAGGRIDYDPWASSYSYSSLRSSHKRGAVYTVRFPELLKAYDTYTVKESSFRLKDEFGRHSVNPVEITFMTDHRKPDYTLLHDTAVLEKNVGTDTPLVVTNINQARLRYRTLTSREQKKDLQIVKDIPEVQDVAFAEPLDVRKMLNGKTGAVYGSVESDPYVEKYKDDKIFFAQVTPYQIQVKAGHFNTLVWVTDLSSGLPVSGADVTIYKDRIDQLSNTQPVLGRSLTGSDGTAMLPGNVILDPDLDMYSWGWNRNDIERFFVKVIKNEDMAVLPLAPRFEVDTYRVSESRVSSGHFRKYGHIHVWGTTAQGVYRAGDTVQFKFYVRDQDNKTLVSPPQKGYKLTIIDPAGKTVHEIKDLELSEFGAYHGDYSVPENATVGWYRFELTADFTDDYWIPVNVLISDFTPSPFRVTTQLNGDSFKVGDEVEVSTSARLHAGGPFTEASTRVVARLSEREFSSDHPLAAGFVFNDYDMMSSRSFNVFEKNETLNDKGDLTSAFTLNESGIHYGRLVIESAVQDDRGKYVASVSSAPYAGRTRYVGLKTDKWLFKEDETAHFNFIIVNQSGKPVSGTKTKLWAERLETKASRVKGAGNAYLTHYTEEWVTVDSQQTDSGKKAGVYKFVPSDPGSYRIHAEIRDTKGQVHSVKLWTWVVGKGRVTWNQPDDNTLQIIPEETSYKIGDTAKYLIKNPFPGATALISVERYGVLKHWVQTLEGSTPVIEFPIEPDFMPGFYFSVTVMSPRVEKPSGDGNVDLGKPAFRTGYVSVPVKDPYREIVVNVTPEKKEYKPGSSVKVSLKAAPRNISPVREPIELAVAVLDEAVFDLLSQGRSHFDPYEGFYSVDGLDLVNYSLLKKLVGIQKFEKKGANTGGDGGSDISMRSVFKFVSYWNPSLMTDDNGEAQIEFTVPDNLTGWRVFVMAVTPTDRMGLGDNGFTVNMPTEVRPVMPNQVTEGDSFKAGFTVMNRTDKVRRLNVSIQAAGQIDSDSHAAGMKTKIKCQPFKRKTFWLPVKSTDAGMIKLAAKAWDSSDGDGMVHSVPVRKRRSLETAATYGTTLSKQVSDTLRVPDRIHTDVGAIDTVLSPTVIGNIEGGFSYMKSYPYSCWEQKLSKGVMASHYINLKPYIPETFSWDNARELVLKTLKEAPNYQAPDGGMCYYKPENRYVSPYLSAYTALSFNWLRKSGYSIPEATETSLYSYLDRFMKRDVKPDFYSTGMASTVRAVALAALSEKGQTTVPDLNRYKSHVKHMSLFGKAMYMIAALNTENGDSIAADVCKQILAHSNQTGGKFMFNEELDDSFSRIHATPIRANAAILSAFTEFGERVQGVSLVGDIPFKLVRYITQTRGNRGYWQNTQENMFCMNALTEYSRVYEKETPSMTVKAYVDNIRLGKTEFNALTDESVTFTRPINDKDPGKDRVVTIKRSGDGRLYYSNRISFAPLDEHAGRLNAGIDIRKEVSVERDGKWILLERPYKIKRGELVRVDLFLSSGGPRNFVVVDDPVPGGLEPVNSDLATASIVDAEKGNYKPSGGSWWFKFSDWSYYNVSRWSFYHQELRHDSVRFYSDWLPAGNYHLSYTAQAIAEGSFAAMPVHAEEMYDPDVFGKGLPSRLNVRDN